MTQVVTDRHEESGGGVGGRQRQRIKKPKAQGEKPGHPLRSPVPRAVSVPHGPPGSGPGVLREAPFLREREETCPSPAR